jgi:hypothetical protein
MIVKSLFLFFTATCSFSSSILGTCFSIITTHLALFLSSLVALPDVTSMRHFSTAIAPSPITLPQQLPLLPSFSRQVVHPEMLAPWKAHFSGHWSSSERPSIYRRSFKKQCIKVMGFLLRHLNISSVCINYTNIETCQFRPSGSSIGFRERACLR